MSDDYFIGVDIGTTGTKTVLLHERHGIIAQANFESPFFSTSPGYAEADADAWVDNAVRGIREVLRASGIAPERVLAIATTGMVPAVVCLDAELRPVRRPMLQNDARAVDEIHELSGQVDAEAMLRETGSALTQQSVAPTALWLSRHEPETWQRTRYLLGSYDYLLVALGADPHVEENWAIESGLYRLDDEPFDFDAGISAEIRPKLLGVVRPGDRVGSLSATAAASTGLPQGTALVVGGADHVLSAFAAGVQEPGDWLIKLGGAGDVLAASRHAVFDPALYLDAHPRQGLWLPNGCMATSGSLIRWYQRLIGGVELPLLDEEAALAEPASLLCLPYFLGEKSPLHDPELRGAFIGLHLGHTRADMYRAVLEAIAFGFRHNAEAMRAAGLELSRALVTNGGSKSTLWKQIHADVLGTPLFPVKDHPGASLGAAIAAAIGVGSLDFSDIDRFLELEDPFLPDPERVAVYDEAYELWRESGARLRDVSHRLSQRDSARTSSRN